MSENISCESNHLFKREVLIADFFLEEPFEYWAVFYELSHGKYDSSDCIEFYHITKNIVFIRVFMGRSKERFKRFGVESECCVISCLYCCFLDVFAQVCFFDMLIKILSHIEEVIISLNEVNRVF
jgi:hypothetical protein